MSEADPLRRPSGRGLAAIQTDWWPESLPASSKATHELLVAHDGAVSHGVLYSLGTPSTVVAIMHPRLDFLRAAQVPGLLRAGFAVWAQNSRDVGNDLQLVHEALLLDVAAGLEHLRVRGFERILLLGASGGAGLFTFYAEQAGLTTEDRLAAAPSGQPVPLQEAVLPVPDGLVLFAPHPGQGRLLLNMIDPSVTDETDQLSCDPELDPYSPANGFAPEGSSFEPAFIKRYRAAQRARIARLDQRAREALERMAGARTRRKESNDAQASRAAAAMPIFTTYRTDADLRSLDLSLDPSDRSLGSIMGPRPWISNFGVTGFGRLTTPHSWLSTWSALSSRASVDRAAHSIELPILVAEYSADKSVFPADVKAIVDAFAKADVEHVRVLADHFGRSPESGETTGTETAIGHLRRWAADRSLI